MSRDHAPGFRALHVDALESVPWAGGLTLRPMAGQLGIRAFGCAAFSAAHAGDPVVEPHAESVDGRGHQELYVVARGHARFVVAGEPIDAPAGTLVFVEDPALQREAVALADDTVVMAFGGEPTFQPGADEVIARVRMRVNGGAVDEAARLARESLEEQPLSPGRQYALALALAAGGDVDFARPLLASALAQVPALAAEVERDAALRDLPPED